MSWWIQRVLEGHLLRKAWVVATILAALLAGMVGFDQSADASSYYLEELQFLQLTNDYCQEKGLETLFLSDTLAVSAERHCEYMML